MSCRKLLSIMGVFSVAIAGWSIRPVHGDLVGYWNFDGNVDDQSGNGNDGELIDAVYSDDVPAAIGGGQSVSFEVDSDHVFVENGGGDLDSETFTLSMFIFDRGQVGALERLTSREGDAFETGINVHGPFNGMGEYAYFSRAGGGWQWSEEIPPLEEWQHVAYVADADEQSMLIYVDGELIWESLDAWFTFPSGFMHIGNRWNNVEGFDGLMDDVAMWDEILSEDDIKTISQGGVAAFLNPTAGGDLNGDGVCDAADIDVLATAIRDNDTSSKFDLNGDGLVNPDDHEFMIKDETLKHTWFGDANLDGEFNSADFVAVFQNGEYEDLIAGNSGWADGDWNGDSEFNSSDFVKAFQDGGYELGPPVAAVPEPISLSLLGFGVIGCLALRRRTSTCHNLLEHNYSTNVVIFECGLRTHPR